MSKPKRRAYPVNKVSIGAEYYYRQLLMVRANRFTWSGLPDTIPQEILERFIIEAGNVAILEREGSLWALPVCEYGVDVYAEIPPKYITANPVLHNLRGKTNTLTSSSVMIYNNPLHESDFDLLRRYSAQLAQVESTIDISLTNLRAMSIGVADNDKIKRDFETFYNKLQDGDITAIVTEHMAQALEKLKLMPTNNQTQSNGLRDLYNLRNNIYRQYLRECGIRTTTEKSQFVSGDEIVNDDILLSYMLDTPLRVRQSCVAKVNERYGTDIAVDINPELKQIAESVAPAQQPEEVQDDREEVVENENIQG